MKDGARQCFIQSPHVGRLLRSPGEDMLNKYLTLRANEE